MRPGIRFVEIMDIVCCDKRYMKIPRHIVHKVVDRILLLYAVRLDLEKEVVFKEFVVLLRCFDRIRGIAGQKL